MRKIFYAAFALLLAACSSNNKQTTGDTDSAFIQEAEAAADSVSLPVLTEQGLGDIRIGMSLDSLPQGVVNLYDRIVEDSTPDARVLNCIMGEETMFTIYNFGENKVDMISLTTPAIGVQGDNGLIHCGDTMESLLQQKGVTTEWVSMDDSGMWYWRYNGLWITPDPAGCPQPLIEAMGNRRTPPSASLIPADLKIAAIATGLPF